MKALRTAILGCGHFAKRHAAILANLNDVQLVGFCDQAIENANVYNQQYAHGEAQVYRDYETMFAELDLDLVYICLPPYAHSNEVELACRYGVHFLIEKPIALSTDLALVMAEQVRVSGVKSQVGFMYRFGEAAQWLKQYLTQKEAAHGRAFLAARYACNSLHSSWWRERAKSGGQLVEQVIHILDLVRFFFGEPGQVYSIQENLFHTQVEAYTVEDASVTSVRFQSGAIAAITATNGAIPNRWDCDWRVFLPGLTGDFSDANHATFHNTSQAWASTFSIAADKDMYLAETLDLLQAIRDDRPTQVPIEEGARSLCFALAAAQSARENCPVNVVFPPRR
jgi:predicted dehydrogenase